MKHKQKKRNNKKEPSIFYVVICTVIITLIFHGCNAYCDKNQEKWRQDTKEHYERKMQESFYNCKFEHDY